MPEHPLDASWGYQVTGYYAPTSDTVCRKILNILWIICTARGIGVILDWVPAHFRRTRTAWPVFDGQPLYMVSGPEEGRTSDWGTYIF